MKNIKKIISVMLAVLIVFFCSAASMVTASAEEVTPSTTYDAAYFKNLFQKSGMDTTRFSLNSLTPDNYAVIVTQSLYDDNINFLFIPKTKENDFYIHKTYMSDDTFLNDYASLPLNNYPCIVGNTRGFGVKGHSTFSILGNSKYYHFTFNPQGDQYIDYGFRDDGDIYQMDFIDGGSLDKLSNKLIRQFLSKGIQRENIYVSDSNLYNLMSSTGLFVNNEGQAVTTDKSILRYVPNLLASLNSIFGGYTGNILDSSVEGLIKEYGILAPDTLLSDYKNKLYYLQNNDYSMVFMNNAEAPSYKKEDYNGIYEGAKKYTFTYAKTYDAIVYFPQYQKYIKFDDWWNANSKGGIDWGAWGNFGIIDVIMSTNDKSKTFYLMSDWNATFSDSGNRAVSGTRVAMSWENVENQGLDPYSIIKYPKIEQDHLYRSGYRGGRPIDQSYPYYIEYYVNGYEFYGIYFNAKPKIEVYRYDENYGYFDVSLIGTCGYMYSVTEDMYKKFDCTSKSSDLQGNLSGITFVDESSFQVVSMFSTFSDDLQMRLYENYKADNGKYIGTKVKFNWNIADNMYNSGDETEGGYDYTNNNVVPNLGDFVDPNGNGHGGSIGNYTDEELNNYNNNNSTDSGFNTPGSDDFQFTNEGILEYCSGFFNFMKNVFSLFPGWIWSLIGTAIVVFIALRVLGR